MHTYRRVLAYFRPELPSILLLLLVHCALAGLALLIAWPMAVLVDVVLTDSPKRGSLYDLILRLLPEETGGRIVGLALLTFLLKLSQDVLVMLRTWVSSHVNYAGLMRIRGDLFRKIQRLHLAYHHAQAPGEMLYRLTQDTAGAQSVLSTLLSGVVAVITLAAILAILGARSPGLTLSAFSVLPLLVVANVWFERTLKSRSREAKEQDTRLVTVVQQSITTIGLVQAFGREADEIARFHHSSTNSVGAWLRLAFEESRYWFVVGTVFGIGGAIVFGYGGWLVQAARERGDPDGLSVGDLLVFVAYLGMLWDPLCRLTGAHTSLQTSLVGVERVFEVLDRRPVIRDKRRARDLALAPRAIELRDVHFSYQPNRPVLRGISVRVAPGELVAFVGPSGAGKTSLLNLLPRFYDPDRGSVRFDEHDARDIKVRDLRRHVALVLQDPLLLPTTVAENIAYGNPLATSDEIRAAGEIAGVGEFVAGLPQGYETSIGEGLAPFSGGQRQRISIARAIASAAPILVLDEPTSALDPVNERRVIRTLADLKGRRTVVLVTHRLAATVGCDRIYMMEAGRIVEQGSYAELFASRGAFWRMATAQDLDAPAEATQPSA
jgi:ABC-type multidrug transport system fused ATPase/permease subunit